MITVLVVCLQGHFLGLLQLEFDEEVCSIVYVCVHECVYVCV